MAGSNGNNGSKAQVLATVHSFVNGNTYEIRKGRDGVVYCSCPSWRFSKERPRTCKHLQEYVEACKGEPVEHVLGVQGELVGVA